MIHAIMKLGEYKQRKLHTVDPIENYLQDPFKRRKGIIIYIVLEKKGKQYHFSGTDVEEYSSKKVSKLLFRRGSSNGPNVTPAAMITDINKTFNIKIIGWFRNWSKCAKAKGITDDELDTIQPISDCVRREKEEVRKKLQSHILEIQTTKLLTLLTIKFKDQGKIQYLRDIPAFCNIIKKQAVEGYRFVPSFGEPSYQLDQMCSICGKVQNEVLGYFSHLKFYTLDKPGFIAGGFSYKDSWKNYPVCSDCAAKIEMGKKFLDEVFRFKFYGFPYHLIPTFLQSESDEIVEDMELWVKEPKFHREIGKRISDAENEILSEIAERGDVLSLRFAFFKSIQSELRILLVVENVLPSRLNALFQLKNQIEKVELFWQNRDGKTEQIYFNFGILREFFPREEKYTKRDRHFLEMSGKILSGKGMDYKFLLNAIMTKLRYLFANGREIRIQVKSAFMLLLYINELNQFIDFRGRGIKMAENLFENFVIHTKEKFSEKMEQFFSAFGAFFKTPAEKAIFLTGVLTQFLLDIQRQEKGVSVSSRPPFSSKLRGLKMTGRQITHLVPQIQEKLEQYRKNYYLTLEHTLSQYYLKAGKPDSWKLSIDDMNFIFVLGMNLSNYFKIKKEEGESHEQN